MAGVTYYRNLLKELIDNGIEPMVTIYHWDLPQIFQEQGGWPNEFIVEKFADYARVCFELFGNDVKYWLTFNEPKQTCLGGYADGSKAPALQNPGTAEYQCTHNVLKSHAKAWHIYDTEFRATQNGKAGESIFKRFHEDVRFQVKFPSRLTQVGTSLKATVLLTRRLLKENECLRYGYNNFPHNKKR